MADWMQNLPLAVQKLPLRQLAIPGSHDSGAFYLDVDTGVAPEESWIIRSLGKLFGRWGKKIIRNWSITQSLSLTDQLEKGVRYVDIRTAYLKRRDDFFVVHGLYGLKTTELLQEIRAFLDNHKKEVVFLDFNHLLEFGDAEHNRFATVISNIFKGKILSPKVGVDASLEDIWQAEKQVIICYHNTSIVQKFSSFWPGNTIYSPWPDTASLSKLTGYLDKRFDDLKEGSFNVFQCVLTPNARTIILHLTSTLKAVLCIKCDKLVRNWLDQVYKEKKKGVNIVMCDFVDDQNWIEATIILNRLLAP